MNIIYEIVTIFLIYMTGLGIASFIPVPASLISMVLFFILLLTKVLKEDKYIKISALILRNLSFFFIVPAVKILNSMDILSGNILKILSVLIISNILVMAVTGKVVQMLLKKGETYDD